MAKTISYAQWALAPYCIAAKLRGLRVNKHLTLARLSAETGLSTALLSKLETNRMIPTLTTLATICRVYGVGLEYFFRDADRHTLSITRKEHLDAHDRGSRPVRFALNASGDGARLFAERIEVAPGTACTPEESNQATCAFAYVLDGILEMNCGGIAEVLHAGDCVYIDSAMPVSWTARNHPCKVLLVRPGSLP